MEIFGIIIGIIAAIGAITTAVANKSNRTGSGNSNSYSSRPYAGSSQAGSQNNVFPILEARQTPRPATKPAAPARPQRVEQSLPEGVGTEGTVSEYPAPMTSTLTEMTHKEYGRMKSRNEQLMEAAGHTHPGSENATAEEREAYSGSLGVTYAGEGCVEHANLRYIGDAPPEEGQPRLTTLQKIIVFGDAINKRKSAR